MRPRPECTVCMEIKSDGNARLAIRKALGQILEYAHFDPQRQYDDAELVIIAPGAFTADVADYLKRM
jgi:hypothetical protein